MTLGRFDPKFTERRYGHMLPGFMSAEGNRLRHADGSTRVTAGDAA